MLFRVMSICGVEFERRQNAPSRLVNFFTGITVVLIMILHNLRQTIKKDCCTAKKRSFFTYAASGIKFANEFLKESNSGFPVFHKLPCSPCAQLLIVA